ncbi:glutamate receptor 2.7-like protein [Cinnamomum micranthum f. kanehirae]|uniref:Glutamate receptor 2.7-like protein n=1 Tax=Cinnamomum micranthum f. kanehirae TaxID=337451 RepID=A0A443PKS3_9MAGN|nr:glutamate receptor 2.7-like protein [Cinnamomum micranthum f. kanehirae]
MKHLQLNWILFLFLCVMRWATEAEAAATDASVAVDALDAVNSSCMSMAFHQYYANYSRRPQKPNTPCDSQNKIDKEASSGVFLQRGSTMAASIDHLINKRLKIGVPRKNGFKEFMNVEGSTNNQPHVKGFPIDVFNEVMSLLPYKILYDFIPYPYEDNASDPASYDSPGYYDSLISKVYFKEFDAVVGDMTITANRSDFVDFTYQYMEAEVSMIVPVRDDDTSSSWWFMEPLTTELWVTTFAFSILKGFLVWFFEHGDNPDFQGTLVQMMGKALYFSFSIFVFANSEKLSRNYSRFVVNVWMFLVFILVTSYGANLTSMLTVERLQPTITDINQLQRNGDFVGCQKGTFVHGFLLNMGFQAEKLKEYSNIEEYADALSKGNAKGGVAAIVDEIPYIKVFLKNHCNNYTRPQWTRRSGGFAFVFPRGSALVPDISRAVLNFTEGDKMSRLEKEWFGDQTTCPDSDSPVDNKRLPLYSLRSIFIIAGFASALAFIVYLMQHLYETRILGLIDKLMDGGLWQSLILPLGRYFQRSRSSNHRSKITPQSETEVEVSTIEEMILV